MAQSGIDTYGTYLDTGTSTVPTPRPSVEVEVHFANEVETGSAIKPTAIAATHIPHRDAKSPR